MPYCAWVPVTFQMRIDHYHGTQMFWSHYDGETNERMMKENGFDIVWSKVLQDSTDPLAQHLFILGQKT